MVLVNLASSTFPALSRVATSQPVHCNPADLLEEVPTGWEERADAPSLERVGGRRKALEPIEKVAMTPAIWEIRIVW